MRTFRGERVANGKLFKYSKTERRYTAPNYSSAAYRLRKKIGVRELAELANVSVGTIDRALNGRREVSEKTRKRILEIAAHHGYTPDPAARALSRGRANIKIGVCIPSEIHYFYDQLRDGIISEARQFGHFGTEVIYRPVKHLRSGVAGVVRQLLRSGIQALVVTPGLPSEAASIIDEAEKEYNVRVVCVVTDVSSSCRSSAVSVHPEMSGRMAAELMANFVTPQSKVAIVTGVITNEEHDRKVQGFSQMFGDECRGGAVVEVIEGREDEEETFLKCRRLLRSYPRLAGIYVNTVNCIPVCKAVEAHDASGSVKVIATDLFAEALPYFANGTITASLYQNPYRQGQTAVRLIVNHFAHGRPFPPVRHLNPTIVLRSNLSLFREAQTGSLHEKTGT
jgi:LacI family transcriptional regulator